MADLVTEFIKGVQEVAPYGWQGIAGLALMFFVRVYRVGPLQNVLPGALKWEMWPEWLKLLLPFALAFAGAAVVSWGMGLPFGAAIGAALPIALSAIGGHEGTKKAGELSALRTLKSKGEYTPSPARKVGSLLIPAPKFAPITAEEMLAAKKAREQ